MKVKLKDITSLITKGTTPTTLGFCFQSQGIKFVKVESFKADGTFIPSKTSYISEECNEALKRSQLKENDILFSIAGAIGRVAIVTKEMLPCNTNQALAIIRIRDGCAYLPYIKLVLSSSCVSKQFNKLKQGVAQLNLSLTDVGNLEIPLPDYAEQESVSRNLERLQTCISARRAQLAKLDELVKCRFVEMFGDPVTNPKQFPCFMLGEIVKFQGGSQPDKKHFEYESSPHNIRLLQIRDYKSDRFVTYIPKALAKRFCSADDIMIGRYGPPIFQILGGIEGAYNVALMKAIPQRGNKEFIRQFLKQDCLLKYLEGLSKRTAGQDGIQMDKLKSYPFPYPPDKLQDAFAAFVSRIDKLRL